ncbi:class I SAM-dependent methyltransferase [Flavobacterium amniphilum]|uniref:class I SAM-dependent methyltransferase n=1 Tax=Flavobacterium amniphilum TaxID=1834035 RepID=UPI00202A6C8B|nr:RsmD family RNA methyltransferase [Flavobacterium amniphilum]MCL9804341.1 class I SAM-dependent methyltransferase [Flavobacterium amniphilum]
MAGSKNILSQEVQTFIEESLTVNFSKLALQKNPFPEISWNEILTQIASKLKAKDKLPTWFQTKDILYPSKLSIEQTSSEITAQHKASIISGESIIDLTGGFGVDAYYFSKRFKKVIHCELKEDLQAIVSNNIEKLKLTNVESLLGDSTEILQKLNHKFDWIYIDPSRRSDAKGKVFMLQDCLPNVPANLNSYFNYTSNILIKTAPILDISAGINELEFVKEIHIVALNGEVKEVLWLLENNYSGKIKIKTINLNKEQNEEFDFVMGDNLNFPDYGLPKKFIYEPNAAILKSGAFDQVAIHYSLEKLHQHSHLYTSIDLIDFPGRKFKISNTFDYNKSNMKKFMLEQKANITIRNFPETVENIRKKWKISDGGNIYSFFTTDLNNSKIVLICEKI